MQLAFNNEASSANQRGRSRRLGGRPETVKMTPAAAAPFEVVPPLSAVPYSVPSLAWISAPTGFLPFVPLKLKLSRMVPLVVMEKIRP